MKQRIINDQQTHTSKTPAIARKYIGLFLQATPYVVAVGMYTRAARTAVFTRQSKHCGFTTRICTGCGSHDVVPPGLISISRLPAPSLAESIC